MKKNFLKTLSIFLAMLMLISGLELTTFASNITTFPDVSLENIEAEQETPNIEEEIISERTAYSKVFSTDDGGFYSIVSATPIHIQDENGNYQNIEEPTAELSTEDDISEYVSTAAENYHSFSQIATYSTGPSEDDILGKDEISLSIKCWDTVNETFVTDGNYVQGKNKGNKIIIIQPSYDNWDIKSNVIITYAKLFANGLGISSMSNNHVMARKITKPWLTSKTDELEISNYYFDANIIPQSPDGIIGAECEWDITNILNEWLLGEDNNGIVLNTLKTKRNCNVEFKDFQIGYYYHEIDNINNMSSFETIDMGLAGTFYVNHFSRNLLMEHNDIGIDGEISPVVIKQFYDPFYYNEDSCVGINFQLNYFSTLQFSDSIYTFSAPNGDLVKLYKETTQNSNTAITYSDSNNIYTLTLNMDSANGEFKYTKFENITISTTKGEKYSFETHKLSGYLTKIEDNSINKNSTIINYYMEDADGNPVKTNLIREIIDGAGRRYCFEYINYNEEAYLSSITVKNNLGETISVGDDNGKEDYVVKYFYTILGDKVFLSQINHIGTEINVVYYYDSQNRLEKVSNENKTLFFTYESDNSNRITNYKITSLDETVRFDEITIKSPSVYQRVFENSDEEQKVINFDNSYNMTYYKDYDGTIIFGTTKNKNNYYINNVGTDNLIVNGSFTLNGDDYEDENWNFDDAEVVFLNETLGIKGDISNYCRVFQMVTLGNEKIFKTGESYAYGGKAQAENALVANENHAFGIYIYDAKRDENNHLIPNQCISYFNFDEIIAQTEQEKMSYFTLQQDTEALFVYLCFDYNYDAQYAYFDDIKLSEYEPLGGDEPFDPYTYDYNNNNSVTSEKLNSKISSSSDYIGLHYKYDDSCNLNYLSEIEDERGITTYYTYDPDNGRLVSIATGAEQNAKDFEYTASGLLSSVKQTVDNTITGKSVEMKTDYGYTDGMLSSVTHNGFSYNFAYDAYGNITDISISTQETPLVSTTYENAKTCQVDTITYANGDIIDYYYDTENPDLITKIDYKQHIVEGNEDKNNSKTLLYTYDEDGNLSSVLDERAKVKITYSDNSYSYILLDNNSEKTLYNFSINDAGNTIETFTQVDNYSTTVVTTQSTQSTQIINDVYKATSSSSQILNRTGTINDETINVLYAYNKDSVTDEFERPISNNILAKYQENTNITVINSEEEYSYNSINDKQTTLISTYRTMKSLGAVDDNGEIVRDDDGNVIDEAFIDLTYSYTYDSAGNITEIWLTDNITNETTPYNIFKYDNANQLILECSATKNCCITYSYDAGGNITEKRVYELSAYDYENNTVYENANYDSLNFSYDTNYKDKLVSVSNNGSSNPNNIRYDDLGNPIDYYPANGFFEWNGRLLIAFETNGEGNRYEYEYDENGLRTRKIFYDKELVSGTTDEYTYEQTLTIEYVWNNGILKGVSITNPEENTSSFMNIIYDENGTAQGYVGITGTPYYFVRDPLGNVTSVVAGNNEVRIDIAYDAWGNPTFPSNSGDLGLELLTIFICYFNPSTYKGYLYDYETGLYYCQSRYYSPVWSRFVNMDDATILNLTQGETLGANLYAYCNNNPVNFTDESGFLAQHWYNKVSNVSKFIDVAIIIISAGKSIIGIKAMRTFIRDNQRKIVKNVTKELVKYIGSMSSVVIASAVEVALTLIGSSVGELIAKALDYIDPWWKNGYKRNNGYVFN